MGARFSRWRLDVQGPAWQLLSGGSKKMASARGMKNLLLPRSSTGTRGACDHAPERSLPLRCMIWPARMASRVLADLLLSRRALGRAP